MPQIIGRLEVWKFKEKLDSWDYTLIDTRTSQEQIIFWKISNTQTHMDVYKTDTLEKIQKLPREGKFLVYCYHGNRSQQVLSLMKELGFQEVYDLIEGIDIWNKT